MDESTYGFPPYPNPRIEKVDVHGFPIVVAEIPSLREGRYPRSHRRVLGGEETGIAGRPVVYSDTYEGAPREPTYCYARHEAGQGEFFARLEGFLTTAILLEFSELRNKTARCVIQTGDEVSEREYATYLTAISALKSEPMSFVRLYFPFGDMTVEFEADPVIAPDEFDFISKQTLQRRIESPLFAFDASFSDVWVTFLASIHWARGLVTPEVLRSVLRMGASPRV